MIDSSRWTEQCDSLRSFVKGNHSWLRALRGGLTQRRLADLARVPQAAVSWVEHGRTYRVGDEALLRLMEVYAEVGGYDGVTAMLNVRQAGSVQNDERP